MTKIYSPLPIKRSSKYGCNYWETYSTKLSRNVRLFSDLEYDHWVLVETDPFVKMFCEQPIELKYVFKGKVFKSIPDMWILYKDDKEIFVEVKYSKDLEPQSIKFDNTNKQINVQNFWCGAKNIESTVKTEKEIRANPILLSNLKMLIPYSKNGEILNDNITCKKILNYIKIFSKITVRLIEEHLPEIQPSILKEFLCCMLYQGIIQGDLDRILYCNRTEVWLNDDKTYHREYSNR